MDQWSSVSTSKEFVGSQLKSDSETMAEVRVKRAPANEGRSSPNTDRCEPCGFKGVKTSSTFFCENCNERLCNSCKTSHQSQKHTSNHKIQLLLFCEPCSKNKKKEIAVSYCTTCHDPEAFCNQCGLEHQAMKISRTHILSIDLDYFIRSLSLKNKDTEKNDDTVGRSFCCKCNSNNIEKLATFSCSCERKYCEECSKLHIEKYGHKIKAITEDGTTTEKCNFCSPKKDATLHCRYCKKQFCHKCSLDHLHENLCKSLVSSASYQGHRRSENNAHGKVSGKVEEDALRRSTQSISRSLSVEEGLKKGNYSGKNFCHKCRKQKDIDTHTQTYATCFCTDCKYSLCDDCLQKHEKKFKNEHKILTDVTKQELCQSCFLKNLTVLTTMDCLTCNQPLCQECSYDHVCVKISKNPIQPSSNRGLNWSENRTETNIRIGGEDTPRQSRQTHPGIPIDSNPTTNKTASSHKVQNRTADTKAEVGQEKINARKTQPYPALISSNSVLLQWPGTEPLREYQKFQIRFKEMPNGPWTIYDTDEPCTEQELLVEGLKAETTYKFVVKLFDENEGYDEPITTESEEITTIKSPALDILEKSNMITQGPPAVYRLPTKNTMAKSKMRKFVLGNGGVNPREKVVLLVGATGSGKSTLINAMANYIMGVTWEDKFRFTLVDVQSSEAKRKTDQARSQTERVTCYTIHNDVSSQNDYSVTLIDTPGFGDTRGLEQDKLTTQQISSLFANQESGVATIDAICFILKAPDARLTSTQKYIFDAIFQLFGTHIKENLCTFITFADDKRPPVLNALEAEPNFPLSKETYFKFNNSALYADNSTSPANRLFWQMGMKSCKNFFTRILDLPTKSLSLTRDILRQRTSLEITIENIQKELRIDVDKATVLKQGSDYFTRKSNSIDKYDNLEFQGLHWQTKKIPKKYGSKNCKVCSYTCHENCHCGDNCCAFNTNMECTQCPGKCKLDEHSSDYYIIGHHGQSVKKSYRNMKCSYEKRVQKELSPSDVVKEMQADIAILTDKIQVEIEIMKILAEWMNKMALRPNSGSPQYIELMIDSEKREKKRGYEGRIGLLNICRERLLNKDPIYLGGPGPISTKDAALRLINNENTIIYALRSCFPS